MAFRVVKSMACFPRVMLVVVMMAGSHDTNSVMLVVVMEVMVNVPIVISPSY